MVTSFYPLYKASFSLFTELCGGPNEIMNWNLRKLSSMAPTGEIQGVHMGLKKDRSSQERSLRSTLKSTGEMSGIHIEFMGAILWFMWILQEKCLCSHLMITGDFFSSQKNQKGLLCG